MGEFLQRQADGKGVAFTDEFGIAKAFMDLSARMLANPWKLAETQMKMFWDYVALWQSTALKHDGAGAPSPVAEPAKGDNRFRDADWQNHFLFDYFKQSYLIAARHIHDAVSSVEGLPEETQKKVNFFTRQYIDALSPSNFALTNPQVLRETLQSGGQNLLRGLNNLLADIERGDGQLRISMTDAKAFKVGVNVATTPGKVVFQNELMQLIQYSAEHRDGVQAAAADHPAVDQQVLHPRSAREEFLHPLGGGAGTHGVRGFLGQSGRELRRKSFEDYMFEGPLAALDAIEKATGEKRGQRHRLLPGRNAARRDARLDGGKEGQSRRRRRLSSCRCSISPFPANWACSSTRSRCENLERRMNERGYLEGSEMAATFNMLRANDLIWSFVINNYLLGKDPFPFDLLYWNSDSTRMPAKMHSFYLRNMYLENKLKDPGGITLGRRADRSAQDRDSGVFHLHGRGPHRALEIDLQGRALLAGPDALRARRIGAHRRHRQSARGEQVRLLDQPGSAGDGRSLAGGGGKHEGSWWNDWQAWIAAPQRRPTACRAEPGDGAAARRSRMRPAPT